MEGAPHTIRADTEFPNYVGEIGRNQVGAAQISAAQVGAAEVGAAEVGATEIHVAQVGAAEVGATEIHVAQVAAAQVTVMQVGSWAKVVWAVLTDAGADLGADDVTISVKARHKGALGTHVTSKIQVARFTWRPLGALRASRTHFTLRALWPNRSLRSSRALLSSRTLYRSLINSETGFPPSAFAWMLHNTHLSGKFANASTDCIFLGPTLSRRNK
jgi:hypothetical protein